MLAINGKPLTECDKNDKLAIHIKAGIEAIKRKPYWKLEFHKSKVRPKVVGSTSTRVEYSAGILQKATSKYTFQGMEHDITYFTGKSTKANGVIKFIPNFIDFNGPLPINPKIKADLLFYMTCISTFCAPYDLLSKWQRPTNGEKFYQVEDVIAEVSLKNLHAKSRAKISSLIYDEDFGLANDVLVDLAVGHGVPNARDIDINLVRHNLNSYLLAQTNGNYNMARITDFLDEVKDSALASLRSNIIVAIEKGLIIQTESSKGNPSWYDTTEEGKKRTLIMSYPIGSDPETALLKHFASKPKHREEFDKYIKAGGLDAKNVKMKHKVEDTKET